MVISSERIIMEPQYRIFAPYLTEDIKSGETTAPISFASFGTMLRRYAKRHGPQSLGLRLLNEGKLPYFGESKEWLMLAYGIFEGTKFLALASPCSVKKDTWESFIAVVPFDWED